MLLLSTLLALVVGGVGGVFFQAHRTAKATGTTVREQLMRNGGPDPVRPK